MLEGRNSDAPLVPVTDDGVIAQTVDSHRLVDFVQSRYGPEKTDQLMESLFKAYFTECRNIADLKVLADVAENAGLERKEIEEYLESGKDYDRVLSEATGWSRKGVNGVPFFLFVGFESSVCELDDSDRK